MPEPVKLNRRGSEHRQKSPRLVVTAHTMRLLQAIAIKRGFNPDNEGIEHMLVQVASEVEPEVVNVIGAA